MPLRRVIADILCFNVQTAVAAAPSSFLSNSIRISWKIDENLFRSASEQFSSAQFPLNCNSNLIENQLESALGCLRAVSFKFLLKVD